MTHQGYGFCEFLTEEDAEYAYKIVNQIKLWGKPIRVNKVGAHYGIVNHAYWVAGFVRQKAAGRRCEPFHRQFGRKRG